MARHKILKSVLSYALVAGVLATSTLPSVMAHAETRNESAATTYAFVNKYTRRCSKFWSWKCFNYY